jgi:hypothetical protein
MNEEGTVNSQIVDSVSSVVTLATGQSASQAFGMLDAVMLETLGMAMHNAVHRQQSSGMINGAAVTATCAKILATPIGQPSPPPKKPDPPQVHPLEGPNAPTPPSVEMDKAMASGKGAISALKGIAAEADSQAATAAATSKQANADLEELIAEARGPNSTSDSQSPQTGVVVKQDLPPQSSPSQIK